MNATTYDLRINSSGNAEPMVHGFFEHAAKLVNPLTVYSYEKRCVLIGSYWVEKDMLDEANTSHAAKTIRAYLAKSERKTSEAQLRAGAKYDAKNTKQIMLKLNRTTDSDVLDVLSRQSNIQGYIKKLIRDANK